MNGPSLSFAALLTSQCGVLIACASAIVVLARGRGTGATVTFAILATLACTAALVWIARVVLSAVDLPPGFMRRMVVADLLYVTLPIAAMTLTALVVARRPSRPSALLHAAVVVAIGLLAWPIAMTISRWVGADMINAVA